MPGALDKLGVALWTLQSSARRPGNHARLYAELVEDARLVEAHGFASIWSAEHHFWHDGWCPAVLHAQATAVAATSRLRFGQAMLLAPLHDPATLARSVLTLDRLSDGRLDLGLALGHRDAEYDGFGLRRDRRGALLDETLAVLAEAWDGGDPAQPGGPPIWVGGMAPRALARAARGGHGLMLPPTLSPARVEALLGPYREALPANAGQARIGMLCDVHVAADEEAGERFLAGLRQHYSEEIGAWWVVDGELGFANPGKVREQVGYNERGAIVGSALAVAGRLEALFAAGVTHLAARLEFDFLSRAEVHEQIELLATAVAPRLEAVAV